MIQKKEKTTKTREVITTGYYNGRYFMIVLSVVFGLSLFSNPSSWTLAILFLISFGLFFLFRRSRRIYYDDKNLYLIRYKTETVVSFKDIVSIKKSRTKINGSRPWILRYKNKYREEKKLRYFRMFFNKEFHQLVKKENPSVVIWTHPFFNH